MNGKMTDEAKKTATLAREKANAKIKAHNEKAAAAAREKREAMPSEAERLLGAVRGLEKFAARTARPDSAKSAKLAAFAAAAKQALSEHDRLGTELSKRQPDPAAAAAAVAGKTLFKVLTGCFGDVAEATDFAGRFLPLTKARREAAAAADTFHKQGEARAVALKTFWASVEKGAALAIGGDHAVQDLISAGME